MQFMLIDFGKHSNKQLFLNKEITTLIKTLKKEKQKKFKFWHDAVGEKISEIAVPYMMKKNVLLVRVSDSVWRFELTKRKDELLKKVNENSEKKIKDIIFK